MAKQLYKCQRCKKKKPFGSIDFSRVNEHMQGTCVACLWLERHERNTRIREGRVVPLSAHSVRSTL